MKILSFKPGHDGSVALVDAGELKFALEGEKDSFARHDVVSPRLLIQAAELVPEPPDVICESGWVKGFDSLEPLVGAGYYGLDGPAIAEREGKWFGHPVKHFSSSHERSHLMGAFGMSPFQQGKPCYALVWEGAIGDFYLIHSDMRFEKLGRPLFEPGSKYSFLYHIADDRPEPLLSSDWPGKVMALAAYGSPGPCNHDEQALIDFLWTQFKWTKTWRDDFAWSPFYRIGVESQEFKDLARKVTDLLFAEFHDFATKHLRNGYPLIIGGGCGLNCEWNTLWRESGLFEDVFVPPCPNDSGSAIGTAVDAMFQLTGQAKLSWSVYAGLEFDQNEDQPSYESRPLDFDEVADLLARGSVIAWVQGRYEIGARALANRSLLAAPFESEMRDRLNTIKGREAYRPIAPICLEEDVEKHFDWRGPSPYMLYFQKVTDPRLKAVTHVDGTARLQTVNFEQNEPVTRLLRAFRRRTGAGVLCNTSLNFRGRGFINSMSDLIRYCQEHGVSEFVVGDRMCRLPNPA